MFIRLKRSQFELVYNIRHKFSLLFILSIFSICIFCFTRAHDTIFFPLYKLRDFLNPNSFEFYFSNYLCDLLVIKNGNCIYEVLNNYNFFYNIQDINKNVNLYLDIKKSFIENLFLIIGLVPFLRANSTINYKIYNKGSIKLYKLILNYKKKKKRTILININDLQIIQKKFNESINYIWESPLQKKILDILRYIIYNYYDDNSFHIYEESVNKNYNYFIKNNINKLSNLDLKELVSK